MTKNQIDDLKQFITVAISASEARLKKELIQRMDEGFAGVADAIEQGNNRLDSHDTRIVSLEKIHSKHSHTV